jgi:HrpA-like RNA helicase
VVVVLGGWPRYGAIVVDEAHERSINMDVLLARLKTLAPGIPGLKVRVIICNAMLPNVCRALCTKAD